MDTLIQRPSDCKPKVIFQTNGNLLIQGRSFGENPSDYFEPMVEFINKLRAKDVILDVKLDYLNTASSKCLFHVFDALEKNEKIKHGDVRWYYESDDEEMQETGEIYAEMCEKIKFEIIPTEVLDSSYSL